MNRSGLTARQVCENKPSAYLLCFDKIVSMAIVETFFDFLSATGGAILGAIFAFFLNRNRNRHKDNQIVIGRQALEKIKIENAELMARIQEKDKMITQLKSQLEILDGKKKK